ncbi:MAG: hypothetical protein ACJAZB_001891 [Psychrosphaera sp.]|jgi:hypothetical protein
MQSDRLQRANCSRWIWLSRTAALPKIADIAFYFGLVPFERLSKDQITLVVQRRLLVEDKRRNVNRIFNVLKQYYSQPLDWLSHRDRNERS